MPPAWMAALGWLKGVDDMMSAVFDNNEVGGMYALYTSQHAGNDIPLPRGRPGEKFGGRCAHRNAEPVYRMRSTKETTLGHEANRVSRPYA